MCFKDCEEYYAPESLSKDHGYFVSKEEATHGSIHDLWGQARFPDPLS